ncbi:hypothetical protein BSN82_17035, partial [Acinetobacter baylyi]|uniref:hypothetical protein n=1 Tax=Acinetobacter baylyi TaxID=202950 RepID=UPI001C09F270
SSADINEQLLLAEEKQIELQAKLNGADQDETCRDTPELVEKKVRHSEMLAKIAAAQKGSQTIIDALTIEKETTEKEIELLQKDIAKIEQIQSADIRISELKSEEKKLASEYTTLERHMYLIDQFTRIKVKSLEESINDKFDICRFRLFRAQVNGGLEDICRA